MKKKSILFCGPLNNAEHNSWDKTNGYFFNSLSKKENCVHFDYSINNPFIRKAYKEISKLYYGETLVRDPIYDFIIEQNFKFWYSKLKSHPDLVIHSSSLCIPKGYEKKSCHVMYTDATIIGAIKYNNLKPAEKALKLLNKETQKYFDRLTCIFTFNEWTRQSLIEDFGVKTSKVVNVGFGANLNPFYGEKDYSNKQILIVLRRGLEKNKGLLLLMEAFKIAHKQDPDIKLAVVGTTLDEIDGITYYEGCPREKTIELFQKASLYAMPALFEPNGMVYIEALACKTPVLGLNRLAFPEFAGNGKFGFIEDENPEKIAHTLLTALYEPEKLKSMGEQGQQFAINRFNWETVTSAIIDKSLNYYK